MTKTIFHKLLSRLRTKIMRTKLDNIYQIIFSIALIASLSFNIYHSLLDLNDEVKALSGTSATIVTMQNRLGSYLSNSKETFDYLKHQLHNNMNSHDIITSNTIHTSEFGMIDNDKATKLARVFQPKPKYSWCVTKKNNMDQSPSSPTGLLYVRVPKTGSSTISSVIERLARRNNCVGESLHDWKERYKDRQRDKSFMIGSIRDPITRAMSRVFFGPISLRGREPTDKNVLDALYDTREQYGCMTVGQGGFQLNYLSTYPIEMNSTWIVQNGDDDEKILNMNYIEENVKQIMDSYDFITLNERMDESLVVLQYLLGLNVTDILYMSSKVAGGHRISKKSCVRMQKSFISKNVSKMLSSQDWFEANYGDYLLHAVVDKSLDMTIQRIGEERFKSTLHHFKALKQSLASTQCATNVTFPCSNDGMYQENNDCLYEDIGCGYKCLDTIVADYDVDQTIFADIRNYLRTTTNTTISSSSSSSIINELMMNIEEKATSIATPFSSNVRLEEVTNDKDQTKKSNYDYFSLKRIYQVMVPEADSNLIAGIVERIHHHNDDIKRRYIAKSNTNEDWSSLFKESQNFKTFFALSSVRHPESRAIHNACKRLSGMGRTLSDYNVLKALQYKHPEYGSISNGQGGFQLNYMTMYDEIPINSTWIKYNGKTIFNYDYIQENVHSIFKHYDFIIVNERLDESLVALQLLLGLKISDILYLSTQLEQQQKYVQRGKKCILQQKTFVSKEISKYFTSMKWYEENYGDYLLHEAAQKSLDLTIKNKIGMHTFEKALHQYLAIKKLANEECLLSDNHTFPCSNDGVYQSKFNSNCYQQQGGLYGCGYRCLDDFVNNISS